jgi:hypothetical protein
LWWLLYLASASFSILLLFLLGKLLSYSVYGSLWPQQIAVKLLNLTLNFIFPSLALFNLSFSNCFFALTHLFKLVDVALFMLLCALLVYLLLARRHQRRLFLGGVD